VKIGKLSVPLTLAGVVVILSLLIPPPLGAYYVQYKEQYYRLYHLHYIQYPDDTMENIYWLEQALKADFANPLYALALIEDQTQWEKYRYLFTMHIYLKLIEQYLYLGNKWNKRNAYFYNAPWKEQNLESLETAETCFRAALSYWKDAAEWAAKSRDRRFRYINLQKVQFWEDEALRVEEGDLDYEAIINRELALLRQVREKFQAMDEGTY
jgi:RNA polymerase-binding transcription factor DksA